MFTIKKIWALILILILISVPIIVNLIMLMPSTSLDIGNVDAWISFFGSYSGGIIGGVATIIGIKLTLDYSRYKDEDEKRRNILPYIQVMEAYKKDNHQMFIVEEFLNYHTKYSYFIFKNIGLGSAIDVKFYFNIDKKTMSIREPNKVIALAVNDIEYAYIKIPEKLLNGEKEYEVSLQFKDLLGNSYIQDIVFLDKGDEPMSIRRVDSPKRKEQ